MSLFPLGKLLSFVLFMVLFTPLLHALELTGSWSQGGMLIGRTAPDADIQFMGKRVRVSDQGVFVIALGRDAPADVELLVQVANGPAEHHYFHIAQRQYPEERVEGVPQRTVTPPEDVLQRIREEAALVRAARADDEHVQYFRDGFRRPLEGRISGVYGSRRIYNGTPGRPHYGLDIAAPTGTPVHAPAAGVVKLSHRDMYYSGGTLIIDHGHGITSSFIHLSKIHVQPGDLVKMGDLIAEVGSSGRATGPHLDWRINWFDVRVDPALVLESFPASSAQPEP